MTFKFSPFARLGLGFFAVLCLSLPLPASAQGTSATTGKGDIMPVTSANPNTAKEYAVAPGEETHPPIRLTADKTEMVKLEEDADSVIIGNPAHVNLILNNPRLMLLTPGAPGATQITILNRAGKVIMQRHVISNGPKEQYVRIRRRCNVTGVGDCDETSVYYCPSGSICHDVQLMAGQGGTNSEGIPGSGAAVSSSEPAPADEELEDEIPLVTSDEESASDTDEDTGTDDSATPSGQ